MKTDVIQVDNLGNGFEKALTEAEKAARYRDLAEKDAIRLRLIAEEMLGMVRIVTGDLHASFWIESENKDFELSLTTRTVTDREMREMLLSSATSRKNEEAKSFLGKLRNAFEEAMAADPDTERYDLPVEVQADLVGRSIEPAEWDRFEQSVLFRLADNVKIGIRRKLVCLTVLKSFE